MDRAAKLASEAARGRDAAMAVQQRRKAPLPEEAAAGSSKRLMQTSSPARREKKEWELEELLAEQARLAPQKMQLRIVWTLLEVEVGRAKVRAREAAALKKTGRVAAPEIPASLPLSSRPPKSGKQLWRKAGMGLVLGLKAFKKDAAVEPRAPTPKAQRQASAGLAAGVSSASPRNSRQQRRADVAARERRAASPREERRAASPRDRGADAAAAPREHSAFDRPRWGLAAAAPEEPSPSSRRLTAKKQRLAKYSVVGKVDEKLRAERRASLAAGKAAAAEQRERDDMRHEERAQRAKRFHFVGRARIFYMRAHAFLQTSVFLNHERDYMVCVTERHAARLHAPVLFKERDLVAAATAYEARATNKANLRLVAPEPALAAGGDVREPTALPPFARHYLFKCGRLTMRGRGDDAGADVSILGVDTFSLGDAVASGNYVDAASFGDYEARALEGWTPEHEAGDELHDSYAAALHEAEDAARRGVVIPETSAPRDASIDAGTAKRSDPAAGPSQRRGPRGHRAEPRGRAPRLPGPRGGARARLRAPRRPRRRLCAGPARREARRGLRPPRGRRGAAAAPGDGAARLGQGRQGRGDVPAAAAAEAPAKKRRGGQARAQARELRLEERQALPAPGGARAAEPRGQGRRAAPDDAARAARPAARGREEAAQVPRGRAQPQPRALTRGKAHGALAPIACAARAACSNAGSSGWRLLSSYRATFFFFFFFSGAASASAARFSFFFFFFFFGSSAATGASSTVAFFAFFFFGGAAAADAAANASSMLRALAAAAASKASSMDASLAAAALLVVAVFFFFFFAGLAAGSSSSSSLSSSSSCQCVWPDGPWPARTKFE